MPRPAVRVAVAIVVGGLAWAGTPSDGQARPLPPNCFDRTHQTCEQTAARPLPRSTGEFIEMRDDLAIDPWGGAVMFAYALMVWEADPALGEQLLVLAVAEDQVQESKPGVYKGYALRPSVKSLLKMFTRSKHCARSYAVGSSPDNDYRLDPEAVALRFRKQTKYVGTIDSGTYKVFICLSGADSCRPLTLHRNAKGLWKVKEHSSLMVGCKKTRRARSAVDQATDDL